MKNINPVTKLISLLALLVTVTACEKTDTITVYKPGACFQTVINDPFTNSLTGTFTNYIDSAFSFRSCIGPAEDYKFKWIFGDGAVSTDLNATHSYAKRGTYTAALVVSNKDIAFDTAYHTLSVVLGPQHLSMQSNGNTYPVAVSETANNEFMLLASGSAGANYYMVQLDSLFKLKSMNSLPAGYYLTSMQPVTDGHYIFTGSTNSAGKSNELIKLQANGTLAWSKSLSTTDSYTQAAQTADGGYAIVGTRPVQVAPALTNYYAVVSKTDNNGNLQWQHFFDKDIMRYTKNMVVDQDGVVIAGSKPGSCLDCDSLLIAKVDFNGNLVWKTSVIWGLYNSQYLDDVVVSKLANGQYAVSCQSNITYYTFSATGEFLDRKIINNPIHSILKAGDGNMMLLQTDGFNTNLRISKLNANGFQKWTTTIENRRKGAVGPFTIWPLTIQPLRSGGYLVMGDRTESPGGSSKHFATLVQLDEAGNLK